MVVKFLERYFVKPIYVFGGFGMFVIVLLGFVAFVYMIYLKLVRATSR